MNNIDSIILKLFPNNNNNYIFIYTPPKVGSTTLVSSLRISLKNQYNVIHLHDEVMLNVLTGINNVTINEIINHLSLHSKNVYVIDVYRSPIERKMSEFFEKISSYHFNDTYENVNNYSIERITTRFNNIFMHLAIGDHYIDKYNLLQILPFDFDKKYILQIINNVTYIKLRLSDVSLWENILTNIFKTDIIIIKDHETENKIIGNLYNKFKTEYKIPINYLQSIQDCKYFKYYNTLLEQQQYIDCWNSRSTNEVIGYSTSEYKLYVSIYLENNHIRIIEPTHYIDDGCYCQRCSFKRNAVFDKLKMGKVFQLSDKIIHQPNKNITIFYKKKNIKPNIQIFKKMVF
jgi:hypothetical protein